MYLLVVGSFTYAASTKHIGYYLSMSCLGLGISIGSDILDPSKHYLSLQVPFLLISYYQWGIRKMALLGAPIGLPNIIRS